MTSQPITPGSGIRLRAYYQRLAVTVAVGAPLIITAVLAIAHSLNSPALTTTIGVAVLATTTLLLLTAIIRSRGALTADTITTQRLRSAGTIATTAMIVAFTGALITLVTGILSTNSTGTGVIAAALCIAPGLVAANVAILSRRLT